MLQLIIAGRVGRDAETKQVGGTDMCSFSVAADSGFGDNKKTIWVDVTKWGAGSHGLASFVRKGMPITVSGEMTTREHDGRTYIQCRADRVELQGKSEGGQREDRGSSRTEPTGKGGYDDDLGDAIPFD